MAAAEAQLRLSAYLKICRATQTAGGHPLCAPIFQAAKPELTRWLAAGRLDDLLRVPAAGRGCKLATGAAPNKAE